MLDTQEGLLKGGDTGPAITPGNPDTSLLIKAVRYKDSDLQMPPRNQKLPNTEIDDLIAWVKMGAPDPRVSTPSHQSHCEFKNHWAFKPIKNPSVPDVQDTNWIKTPVDAFILAKLQDNGMKPNPLADKTH